MTARAVGPPPPPRFAARSLSGWGRFPVADVHLYRPEKQAALAAIVRDAAEMSLIARGLGRSYGDAALNAGAGVVGLERLNRMLSFDPVTGVLECEAGVSFAEIVETFLPRGFFPGVTPGTKFVTVGGAIACDVHGKNHHRDGTIASTLVDLRLLLASGELLTCSPTVHPDVFWATVGGLGLTGVIISASFTLRAVETGYVTMDRERARDLDDALERFDATDQRYRYSVAWIDGLARGRSLGRSVLMQANDTPAAAIAHRRRAPQASPRSRAIPFDLPSFALNSLSVGAFNAAYYATHGDRKGLVVGMEPFYYPLDRVHHWNRLYGRRGFVQYQAVFPTSTAREGLRDLLERAGRSRRPSFLAVLKRFGPANDGMLSFPHAGFTLAIDMPAAPDIREIVAALDAITLRHGGRVYLAKDAALGPEAFAAMYPRADEFCAVRRRLDPERRFSSSLSRRIGLDDE